MKRIAYISPLNPAPSGISDYSEELLPYLGQHCEITLYADEKLRPTNRAMLAQLPLRPLPQLERDQRQRPYDAVIYHMGNSPVHAPIWAAMRRVPGVVVLHEFVLNHFMLNYAAVVRRDVAAYEAEAARRYGPDGQRVAQLMMRGRLTDAAFDYPFCEPVLEAAEGLIAHSQHVIDRAAQVRPGLPSALVPMGVPLPAPLGRAAARARLGIPAGAPILASFGHINPYKRIEPVLRAMRELRERYPGLRYILVGSVSANYPLRSIIERHRLEDAVTVTGYVERADFEAYVAAADICLNLRHPTAGETSASLLRLLGAGRPTLVTASGSFTELPRDVAAQVDPDASEGELLLAYCYLLLARPDVAAQLGANARAFVARQHTLEQAAQGYMRFLAQRYGWPDQPAQRPPLWQPEPEQPASPPAPAAAQPATAPATPTSPAVAATAQAIAAIGGSEADEPLLRSAARAIGDLGL
ncbi:glycosyltransferase family 4 protein [Chloroflexia bacterium SDU3-3]|nr:glycosyltransferase family 4 protein [Chloroflexia bacterium SDU3-3]